MSDKPNIQLDQGMVDQSFSRIWIGLGLSSLALVLYIAAAGSVLKFPAFALIGGFLLAVMPFTSRDDYIRAIHSKATNAALGLLAFYLIMTGIMPVIDPVYTVTFEQGTSRPDRIFSGWAAYWFDGLIVGIAVSWVYFAAFLFHHYRQGS